jgi:Tol biopolymer transport system component
MVGFAIVSGDERIRTVHFSNGFTLYGCDADEWPQLSPDGRWVVYADRRAGRVDWYIASTEAKTNSPRRLTAERRRLIYPRWSPDNRTLAFVTDPDDGDAWIVDARTGRARLLGRGITNLAWSPSGRQLVVSHGHADLELIDLQGEVVSTLISSTTDSVFDVSWAPANTIAFVQNRGDSSQDKCLD